MNPWQSEISSNQSTKCAVAKAVTDSEGIAIITVKVPGAFSGFTGYKFPIDSGRYLEYAEAMIEDGELGDICLNIELQDLDGVIPVQSRVAFPSYPVLATFVDSEAAQENRGWHIWPNIPTTLDAAGLPDFVPSGLYMVATFKKKTAVAGKGVFVNFKWSKYEISN